MMDQRGIISGANLLWCVMEIVSVVICQWMFALKKLIYFNNGFCIRMNFP